MNATPIHTFESIGNMGSGQMVAALIAAVFLTSAWASPAWAQPIVPTYADVVYATVDGQPLHMDAYLPVGIEDPTPLVLWIHGGGWSAGDKYPPMTSAQSLLDSGFAVASINYRLTSDPNFPNRIFPAQIHDVKGAVRFLRAEAATYNLDPDHFGAWGGSAGGHLAALLGTSGGLADLEGDIGGNPEFSSLVQAAASFCGASDFWTQYPEDDAPDSGPSQLIGHALGDIKANVDNPNPPYPELVARMDAAGPITHVSSDDPPFFLAHGDEDDVVPPAQSADLAAALEAVGVSVSYHPVPGVGHGGIPEMDDLAVEFFVVMLGDGNLLANSSFENGSAGQPDGWMTFPPVGPTYTWDNTYSQSGDYSVKIEVLGAGIGIWLQVVDVSPGVVYTLTGQVSFENIVSPGHCNLRVVFRDASNQIIELVDLAAHDGSRPFELDFPYAMKFRAPDDAVTAEINCFLEGPGTAWFDDLFFGVSPVGSIAGTVTSGGQPLPDARVWISSDPWDKVYEAYTNEFGQYLFEDVPVAFPRYILLAEKAGYRTKPTGDVDVPENDTVTVDFELSSGSDPLDDLRVKYGFLEQVDFAPPAQVPTDAVIPFDPAEYPASVQPYLASDAYITSDDPEIVALAQQILDGLAPADRNDTYKVAWAAYEWIVKNINHDGVFTNSTRDVTSGIYQTIQGGWCWGRNFYDWGYKPAETLAVKCAICVEHSWLSSAVLRALNIPARARVGSAQFWVQKPGEYGYWVGLSTSGGSNAYREHGTLGSGFGDSPFPTYFSVTSEPFLAEDWNAQNKGLWYETHPWGENYPATPEGLAQVHADLDTFEETGNAPYGQGGPPGSDRYTIHYSDITINLYNVGSQRLVDTRFPIVSESETHHDMERQAWWTSYPECVTRTWIEEITNPPVEGMQRWYHIEFDLTRILGLGDFDRDLDVDMNDLDVFLAVLLGQDTDPIHVATADMNGDEVVNGRDIQPFVEQLLEL